MWLDMCERKALMYALEDFKGDVYLFGSRVDTTKKGDDIDQLLIPKKENNPLKLSMQIESRILRNKIAHSYLPELLRDIYDEIIDKSQVIFESVERIQKYLSRIGIST